MSDGVVGDRGSGEQRVVAPGVARLEDCAGVAGAFDGRIELVEDGGDNVVAGVDVVGLDGVAQVLEVRGEQLRQGDRQCEVEFGQVEEFVEQIVELVVIEVAQLPGCDAGLVGEVGAREVVLAGPAVLSAAAFELAT